MNRLIIFAASFLLLVTAASAQIRNPYTNTMMSRCPNNKGLYASFTLPESGDLMFTPCPDKSNIFNHTTQIRKGSTDYYPYALALDIVNEYSTNDLTGRNMGSDFYVMNTPFSYSSNYTNASFNARYYSPNRAGSLLGLFSNAALFSDAPVHDIQAIHGESTVVSGTAASGLYAGVFNVGVFGGTNHGNISDLTIGGSTVQNTDIRNYYRLWIKKPNLSNLTIRDGRNYSIYQEGQYGSEFQGYMFLNNANANSSGAAVTPFQIKLANAQSAEAMTVRDFNDMPLFSLNSKGQMRVANSHTPASSSESCAVGTISWDANNIYVCVAPNTWKKSSLSAW